VRRQPRPIEKVICGDEGLGRADGEMAGAYAALRQTLDADGRESLLKEQRLWLQSRFEGCAVPAAGEPAAAERPAMAAASPSCNAARTETLRTKLAAGPADGRGGAGSSGRT